MSTIGKLLAALTLVLGTAAPLQAQITGPRPQGGVFAAPLLAPTTPTDCTALQYSFQGDPNSGYGYDSTPGQTRICTDGTLSLIFGASHINIAGDVPLVREGAGHLFQKAAAVAQRASWANTYTSATNNESFSIDWQTQANVALVGTRTATTGSARRLFLSAQADNAVNAYSGIRILRGANPDIQLGVYAADGTPSSTATPEIIRLADFTSTATSGTVLPVTIRPTYNQTSGTAANTDLLINRTETAVGSGAQRLADFQVGGVSRWFVTNTGQTAVVQTTIGAIVEQLTTLATNDDPTERFFQNRIETTGATVTTLQGIDIPASTTVGLNCTIVARRTGGTSGTAEDGAMYQLKVVLKNVAGIATEIAAETVTVIGESQAAWTVTAAPSGDDELIQVTGAANNNITWHSHCRSYPVGS